MSELAAWLLVGIPGSAVVAALLVGRSKERAAVGLLALAALFVFFLTYVDDVVSAAVIGTAGTLLIAAGRGPDEAPEQPLDRYAEAPDAS